MSLITKFKNIIARTLTVRGDLTVDTDTFFVDATNNRVGIGTKATSSKLHVLGDTTNSTGLAAITTLGLTSSSASPVGNSFGWTINGNLEAADGGIYGSGGLSNYWVDSTARTSGWRFNTRNNVSTMVFADAGLGIGTTTPSAKLHILATTEQLRVGYDSSNYWNASTSSTGVTTLSAVGSGAKFVIANNAEFGANATIPDIVGDTSFTDDVEVLGVLTLPNQPLDTNFDALTVSTLMDNDFIYVYDEMMGGGTINSGVASSQSNFGWFHTVVQGSSTARYGRYVATAFLDCVGTLSILTGVNRRDASVIATQVTHLGGGSLIQNSFNSTTVWKTRFRLAGTTSCVAKIGFLGALSPNGSRFIGMDATPASSAWTGTTAVSLNAYVRPTAANGRKYYASVAGTTGASEPTWPTSGGGTVVDGTVTWTEDGRDGSANFQFITRDSTNHLTGSIADSGIAVDTNWHIFTLRYLGSNNWGMKIDSGTEQILNIAVATLHFGFACQNTTTSAQELMLDYCKYSQIGR